jgi:signal transduction histidine kinase
MSNDPTSSPFRALARWLGERQPRSLRTRLVIATTGLSLILVVSAFSATYRVASVRLEQMSQQRVTSALRRFRTYALDEHDQMDAALVRALSSGTLRSPATGTHLSEPGEAAVEQLQADARATAVLWVSEKGDVLYTFGAPADVRALQIALATEGALADGLLWLPTGGAAVVARFVPGRSAQPGLIFLARSIDTGSDRMPALEGVASLAVADPSAPSQGPTSTLTVTGYTDIRMNGADPSLVTALLRGRSGSSGGLVTIRLDNALTSRYVTSAAFAALGVSLLAGLVGAGFGLLVSQAVQVPLERTVRHVREQGGLALEGRQFTELAEGGRYTSTSEFDELGRVVNELMSALTARQAELREATALAQRAEESLRIAVNESPQAELLLQEDKVVIANPAATAILGVPMDQLVGRALPEVFAGIGMHGVDDSPLSWDDVRGAVSGPLVVRFSRDGQSDRWVELLVVEHEAPRRILLIGRDITEERRREAVREEIFTLVSHDLRGPLTVIQGYLDILQRPLQDDARDRAIQSASTATRKMTGLLDDVLEATRAEQVLAPALMQAVDPCALAEEVAATLGGADPDHEVTVACETDAQVIGDRRRLRQALTNLVGNAFKYAPSGTTVAISVTETPLSVLISVEDEGPGIPPEARATVFERYRRLDATAGGKPGLGLGLYIVRIIAENHGGSARVEGAAHGTGARFVIELPRAVGRESAT